ncbi:hypothetical protein [Haliangium sp.]|uniref:hypothetical protein n=1 Tax=Haliangium sp. TaxID=2663208 RepID=UPI003D0E7B69
MSNTTETPWLRYDEIAHFIDSVEDARLRAFLSYGITTIMMRRGLSDKEPAAPFDLIYFLEVLRAMFARREVLEGIVSGDFEKFAWPDE